MKIKTLAGLQFESLNKKTVLQSALDSGFVIEYSCKNGRCGVCKTNLLEGQVRENLPQLALTQKDLENNKFLTCCCEPVTDILIDSEDLSALHGIETKTLPVKINSLKKLSHQIIEIKLRLPPAASMNFLEGQYIDVIGPKQVRRSYSIASTTQDNEITLLIKKVQHGVLSHYWFEEAKINDLLRIEGPKGTFYLRDQCKPLAFLATGTGIAPVMAILNKLDKDLTFEQSNNISLFWGNREEDDFVWQPSFKNIKLDINYVLSTQTNSQEYVYGYVQDVALSKISNLNEIDVYACGSNNMILAAKQKFINAGLNENNFYSDAFVQSA